MINFLKLHLDHLIAHIELSCLSLDFYYCVMIMWICIYCKANVFFFIAVLGDSLFIWHLLVFVWFSRKLSDGQWWKAAEEVLRVRAAVFSAAHERLAAALRSWILWRDSVWRAGLQPHGRPACWLRLSLHHGLQNGKPVRMLCFFSTYKSTYSLQNW